VQISDLAATIYPCYTCSPLHLMTTYGIRLYIPTRSLLAACTRCLRRYTQHESRPYPSLQSLFVDRLVDLVASTSSHGPISEHHVAEKTSRAIYRRKNCQIRMFEDLGPSTWGSDLVNLGSRHAGIRCCNAVVPQLCSNSKVMRFVCAAELLLGYSDWPLSW
jgi:hypothetical protein